MNIQLILKNVIQKQSEINGTLNKILFEIREQESYKQKYLDLFAEKHPDKEKPKPEILALAINSRECNFSVRTINSLTNGDIKTIGELLNLSKKELQRFRNLGIKSMTEIMEFLDLYNLKLKRNVIHKN
jgi:DNA-directed RNA polymerase alpha subunit